MLGIASLSPSTEAALIALVDHPRVVPSTVASLLIAWRNTGAAMISPTHAGRRGHPYLLARAAFASVLSADATATTRTALARLDSRLDLVVDDPGVLEDLDTAEAIRRAQGC
jgi:molybdenum cofactor cytidylyltransferase